MKMSQRHLQLAILANACASAIDMVTVGQLFREVPSRWLLWFSEHYPAVCRTPLPLWCYGIG
ncbi:MAG: hypothetical protein QMD32_06760, partial [Smithellaceae bacterium]|nr:hypothetical protein [Smithellaceae bacterium]